MDKDLARRVIEALRLADAWIQAGENRGLYDGDEWRKDRKTINDVLEELKNWKEEQVK
jgi:hypothetical protein